MSLQDLPPGLDETTDEPEDLTVRRLVRAIDYAEGFWLGFAKSNTPAQRRRLSALCRDLLEPLKIRVLEIELTEPVTDLLPVIRERMTQEHVRSADGVSAEATATHGERPKLSIFVHGLEHSIPSREAYPPLLSSLNLKRELFRQEVPHPLLLWLPDYALTALARKAPDFWAWRSGLYEFAPEREATEKSFEGIRSEALQIAASFSEQAKRERLVMLKGLLDDYRELGDRPREQEARVSILNDIGLMHQRLGELVEAEQAYKESLTISRHLEESEGEAVALHNLARIAQGRGELEEARSLYGESLEIKKRIGGKRGIAVTIYQLAVLAHDKGEVEEARRLYGESLEIAKMVGDERTIAGNLHGLAWLTHKQGDIDEARRLYGESLDISKKLGDQSYVAVTLHQLGIFARDEGDLGKSRRLYGESLDIKKKLGDQHGVAVTLFQLGRLAEDEGNKAEAARLFSEALGIFERLKSPYKELALRGLERTDGRERPSN